MRASLLVPLLTACSTELPAANPPDETALAVSEARAAATPCVPGDPAAGAPVSLSGVVVTAIDGFDEEGDGKIGTVYVEEAGGGPSSGIAIFAPTGGANLRVGDLVDVSGNATLFQLGCIDDAWTDDTDRTVTQIVSARVTWTGEWSPPEPAVVSASDFSDDVSAETWEGVLVRLEDVVVQTAPDEGFRIGLTADLQIDDDLYRTPDVLAGTTFASVTGVVSYIYEWSLLPRGADDVIR